MPLQLENTALMVIPISPNYLNLTGHFNRRWILGDFLESTTEVTKEKLELLASLADSSMLVILVGDVIVGCAVHLEAEIFRVTQCETEKLENRL